MATTSVGTPPAGAPRPAARPAGRTGNEEFHSAPLPVAQDDGQRAVQAPGLVRGQFPHQADRPVGLVHQDDVIFH